MADIKVGDRVRRTRTHVTGYPEEGYEFIVGSIDGTFAYEDGGGPARHSIDALERVIPTVGEYLNGIKPPASAFARGGYVGSGVTPVELSPTDRKLLSDVAKSGEVRTTSSTGGEKGVKPEAYALVPWDAMDEIARVYEFGAQKYADHNWRKGYEWSKSFSALCRHIFAFWKGEDRDPESGLSHLAHAGFHVLGLLSFWMDKDRYGQHDDRYKS